MALVKCPRCELNYMQATDKYCSVCRREMRGEEDHDAVEICSNCGERPVVPGEELCAVCLKEITSTEGFAADDTEALADETAIDLPGASEMEEIEIDEENIPAGEFQVIKRELGDEEEEGDFVISLNELEQEEEEDGDDEEEEDED